MRVMHIWRGLRLLVVFLGLMPWANLRFLLIERRRGLDPARAYLRQRAARALHSCGARVSVTGVENIPAGPCVFVYNEASLVDLLLLFRHVYEHANAGVWAEVFRFIPGMTRVTQKQHIVMFRRGDRAAADRMLHQVTAWVRAGRKLAMGGEGRLMRDGSVGHFKRGGCLVAVRAGVPVVPVALSGGAQMMPVGSLAVRPGPLSVSFGAPLDSTPWTEDTAPDFAAQVRDEVIALRRAAQTERA